MAKGSITEKHYQLGYQAALRDVFAKYLDGVYDTRGDTESEQFRAGATIAITYIANNYRDAYSAIDQHNRRVRAQDFHDAYTAI